MQAINFYSFLERRLAGWPDNDAVKMRRIFKIEELFVTRTPAELNVQAMNVRTPVAARDDWLGLEYFIQNQAGVARG